MKKFLTIFVILLITITLAYAQESQVKLIGLAIAEKIGEDEYGLTLIDGVFSIIQFKDLPHTDSFPIYSRWMGYGDHEIEINILNPSKDKILATTKDSFKLETKNEVIYSLDYLKDVAFEKSGVHWIQAKADGNIVKEIPLFILEEDEDIETEEADKNPILLFSLPCIEVYENDNGLTSISGVFEYYTTQKLPFTDSFLIANGWLSGEGSFTQKIEIISPSGKVLYSSETQEFDIEIGSIVTMVDYVENLKFEEEGDYLVKVYLNNKEIDSHVLKVVLKEE